ncbi:MAG: DUF4380 domain-containing protein [Polyangiaceae bacterium]|nr:DUF4380 domain-containing protein [Polyangiaceae bacterium]
MEDVPARLVGPVDRGSGVFALELESDRGSLYFEANAHTGGRITVFRANGLNLLTGPEVNATNWGSTFWPSPQVWPWPPDPAFDSAPYAARIDGTSVVMTSPLASVDGVGTFTVIKRFAPDLARLAVDVEYTIKNDGQSTIRVAPWEVTRVAKGGLSFFPAGEGIVRSGLATTERAGVVWFREAPEAILQPDSPKLFADGAEGWIAHVASNVLFLKRFPKIPVASQARPDEAEIEIYVNPTDGYIELEPQGALTELVPGASLSWTVTWYARVLPGGVTPAVGNGDLLGLVRSLVR